jgi:3-dehydroquinate dehydratase/shikimate dehydrogenase
MPRRALFPKVCIALGFPDAESLVRHALDEVEAGEEFLEFRLDYLADPLAGVRALGGFVREYPQCSVLATCRRHQNHGRFNGSIDDQIRVLEAAIDAGAFAVDVEIESAENAPSRLEPLRSRAALIVSYHSFTGTPLLEPVLRRMLKLPADCYKLVTTARKPSDIQRTLALGRANPKTPLVMLAMGELGFPTRVLSAAFGGQFTYAAPRTAAGTASGQVCSRQLRQLYRVDKLSRSARVYGVIADPVRHSISPAVHNRAFQSRRIDSVYLPLLVSPAHLKDFFGLAASLPVAGFSVTIPHKQKVMRYLDSVDRLAMRIGAVNTVWRRAGKWRGANTDVEGVVAPLKKRLTLSRSSVLVAGTGGAARGAAFALVDAGSKVSIAGRNPDRARALAKACGATWMTREQAATAHFDALVHCTPLGMYPHVDECFFRDRIPAGLVFDMVYNPLETQLLRRAREQGAEIVAGIQMFVEQAVRQFEIWTGDNAPRQVMERAALEALGSTAPIMEGSS